MNLALLDKNFELVRFIDEFESLVWTERFNDYGDFELVFKTEEDLLDVFKEDYYIQNTDVIDNLMIIDHIEKDTAYDDATKYTITGKDLSSILDRRVVVNGGEIRDAEMNMVMSALIRGNLTNPAIPERRIENLQYMGLPASVGGQLLGLDVDMLSNLGDVTREICGFYNMGYRITVDTKQKMLYLKFFVGTDRSKLYDGQYMDPEGVIFSSNYENLIGTSYLKDTTNVKNAAVAYLSTEVNIRKNVDNNGKQEVVSVMKPLKVTASAGKGKGLERKEIGIVVEDDGDVVPDHWINETNTNSDEYKFNEAYLQYEHYAKIKAAQEIAKKDYTLSTVFDAELESFNPQFKLNEDYFLGDIVLVKQKNDILKQIVTEVIYSYDTDGPRVYCTFSDAA